MSYTKVEDALVKADYLRIDPPIPGQIWGCVSFISPVELVEKRALFNVQRFLAHRVNQNVSDQAMHMAKDLNGTMLQSFNDEINKLTDSGQLDLAEKLTQIRQNVLFDEEKFVNKMVRAYFADPNETSDQYQMYVNENYNELENDFSLTCGNRTSTYGFKLRGVFAERSDADKHAKHLRDDVEPAVDVGVCPVGYWVPWDPHPDRISNQEHMVPELNTLMKKYYENVQEKNKHYEERKAELAEKTRLEQQSKDNLLDEMKERRKNKNGK